MSYIETFSGKRVDLLDPDSEQIDIEDIARALAYVPRFAGHTKKFYSVGAHSINVSRLVPEEFKLQALLHDATEAYLGDMPTPFKRLLPDYAMAERRIWAAICEKFDLDFNLSPVVKQADRVMLMTERDVLKPVNGDWGDYEDTLRVPVDGLLHLCHVEVCSSEEVRTTFLAAFTNLMNRRALIGATST